MLRVAARDAHEQIDLAAQPVRLHDLGNVGQLGGDARQVRLADHDADERLDGVPESRRRDRPFIGQEDPGSVESGHAGLHSVARESEPFGEGDHRGSRVCREGGQQLEIDLIEGAHSAKH